MADIKIKELKKRYLDLEKKVKLLTEEKLQQDKIIKSFKQIELINADMNLINQAIINEKDLHKMLGEVMNVVVEIFNCDRAWLLYPADPNIDKYQIPIMKTNEEWYAPEGLELEIDREAQFVMNEALKTKNCVEFYSTKTPKLPENIIKEQGVKSQLIQIINPNIGKKWVFGIHQCSNERTWQDSEKKLFEKITARIIESLNNLLYYRDMLESEKKFKSYIENSPFGIFVTDEKGNYIDVNTAACKITGYSKNKLLNMSFIEIIPIEDRNIVIKHFETAVKTGSSTDNMNFQTMDSSIGIWSVNTVQLDDTIYLNFVIDITNERKLEHHIQQAQKMESIGALAGGIAHDFNNLLTVINGYAEIALMKLEKSNPVYNKVELILNTGKRAENLTRQLLAFSRKQIYKAEITNVNQVISSLYKMISRLIGEDIETKTVFTDNLPNIKADKSQLEQIFINLIVNAHDAFLTITKSGFQKKITIETGVVNLDAEYVIRNPGSSKGQHIFFAVSDNGIGMDEVTKKKIFEPFFTTKKKGTGLGLSTVYGIVKQNNGSIYAYSELGKGTTFKIYWPVTDEKIIKKPKISTEILHGNETILIVEDERDVCSFACESLVSFGYNVFTAENGRLALDLIKKESLIPDLIVTDLIMPELNGKEFIEKVKDIYPNIKTIFVSGYTDNHIVHNGMLEKGINFVQKPYSYKTLVSEIRKILDE